MSNPTPTQDLIRALTFTVSVEILGIIISSWFPYWITILCLLIFNYILFTHLNERRDEMVNEVVTLCISQPLIRYGLIFYAIALVPLLEEWLMYNLAVILQDYLNMRQTSIHLAVTLQFAILHYHNLNEYREVKTIVSLIILIIARLALWYGLSGGWQCYWFMVLMHTIWNSATIVIVVGIYWYISQCKNI